MKFVDHPELSPLQWGPGVTPRLYGYWSWLDSTKLLQSEVYGYDLKKLSEGSVDGAPPELITDLARYIEWNLFAAYQELAETAVEFSWKPWAADKPFVNRQRIINEIVDVQHFLGNILVAMGVDDDEYEAVYKRKQELNRKRQASGAYSARKGGLGEGSDNE